jgi:EcsC protein family
VRLIAQIASRFGVVVTQKLVAQAVPLIGALGGAAVNYAFIDHFQEVARAHFVVRRLERRYGKDAVRAAYERLSGRNTSRLNRWHAGVHRSSSRIARTTSASAQPL